MKKIKSFTDLYAWQKGHQLSLAEQASQVSKLVKSLIRSVKGVPNEKA